MCRGDEVKLLSLGVCILGYKWLHAVLCGGGVLWLQAHVALFLCPGHEVGGNTCVVWVGLC